MIKKNYLFILLIAVCGIVMSIYSFSKKQDYIDDNIFIIKSNLGEYRIIPQDKGGLTIYDLKILDE